MNDFVSQRMSWLAAIAADPKQRGLALSVAVLLVAKFFNSQTGKAWPGTERLAKDLNADRRNLRRVIDQLVDGGYLRRERNRNRGSGHTNIYTMREKEGVRAPVSNEQQGGRMRPERRAYSPFKEGVRTPRILEESKMNPRNDDGARERSRDSGSRKELSTQPSKSTRPSLPSATFPPELKFGEAHAREASRIAGWDRERAQREFESCRGWHLDHDTRRMGWDQAWRNWCETGKGIDARKAERDLARRPGRQKDVEGLQGAYGWLEGRRRRAAAKASGGQYDSNVPEAEEWDVVDDD
jgi:DNA-binding MarR family transcriptional regulator